MAYPKVMGGGSSICLSEQFLAFTGKTVLNFAANHR